MQYAKEYTQLTDKQPPPNMTIAAVIEEGLPVSALDNMTQILGVNKSGVASLLGVTTRTLQQRSRKQVDHGMARLNDQLSDRAIQLTRLMNEVIECFGGHDAAMKWMRTPNIGLGDKTPLSLCNSYTGMDMVRNSINRLKYGLTA